MRGFLKACSDWLTKQPAPGTTRTPPRGDEQLHGQNWSSESFTPAGIAPQGPRVQRPARRCCSADVKILVGLFLAPGGYGGVARNLPFLLDRSLAPEQFGLCLGGAILGGLCLLGGSWLILSELLPLRKRGRQVWNDIKGSWKTYVLLLGCLVAGLAWLLLQLEVLPS